MLYQTYERVVNSKGTGLRKRIVWTGVIKLGTMPASLLFLEKPEVGKLAKVVDYNDRWKVFEVRVNEMNGVCLFCSYKY